MTPNNLPSNRPRWDTDERGAGVGGGDAMLLALDAFRAAMASPDWITEDPERYLGEHVRRVCSRDGARLKLLGMSTEDAVFVISLEAPNELDRAAVRAEVLTVLGAFSEASTFVREVGNDTSRFEVATGMLDGDGMYAGHGHLLRFVVERTGG